MSDNIGNPLHTGISVYDMEESIAWYEKNLGFLVVKDDGFIALLRAHVVFLRGIIMRLSCFSLKLPIPLPEGAPRAQYRPSDRWYQASGLCYR